MHFHKALTRLGGNQYESLLVFHRGLVTSAKSVVGTVINKSIYLITNYEGTVTIIRAG